MKRYEALQEMIQGHLDGMRDILDGNVSSNANRSNSYRYAYEEAVASWKQRSVGRPRNKAAEEAAIEADIGCLTG